MTLVIIYYVLGWIWATIALILISYLIDCILDLIGLERLITGDLSMSYEIPNRNHNIGGYFIMKKIKFGEFREEFYQRGIMNIRKLRQIQISRFGIKFWKDIDPKVAKNQLIKCEENIKTQEDCINYSNRLMQEYMDYSKPLWEFHLVENYSEDLSAVLVRMHHSFTDGVGFVSMMSCINDKKFTLKMDKKFSEPTLLMKLITTVISPFIIFPLLMKNRFLCSDPESAKCNDLKNEDKFKTKFFSSDLIPFDDIQKCYKKFPKTTFNDYIMGVLSIGVKRWLKQNCIEDTSKILMLIPINMRGLPNSIKELKIGNYIVALRVELKLCNKLSEAISCAQAEIKHRIKPIVLMIANSFTYFMKYLPEIITKRIFHNFYKGVHIMFSNVPLSSEPWHFCNKEILEFGIFANCQINCNLNFVCITYKKMMKILIMANSEFKMDPQQLIDNVINEIKSNIQSCEKLKAS